MSLFKRKRPAGPERSEFERRPIPGIPSAFTGGDTTIGEMRDMARACAGGEWETPVEKGLAMSLLAVLDLFEAETKKEAG